MGENYGISVAAEGYLFHSENFNLPEGDGFNIVNKDIELKNIKVGNNIIDFKAPYERISIFGAINKFTGIDISKMDESMLRKTAKDLNIEIDNTMGKGKIIDSIFGDKCESNFLQPTFITDYPKEMSPLTKVHRNDKNLTERFELIVNGKEIANAYSELNDPIDQKERFEKQLELSKKGDLEAGEFIDHDFLRALEYGMPPTSGIGIGIDRLVMLMTNNSSIQEVLFFPQMRPCLLYTSPSPRDRTRSRMPSSA